jgi:hypothetical protein
MNYRPATNAEILASFAAELRNGWKVRFRHFIVEKSCPGSAHGVAHKQFSHAKLRLVDGAPFVVHHGKLQPIAANVTEIDGHAITFDLRIKSEYLP